MRFLYFVSLKKEKKNQLRTTEIRRKKPC